jgi:hypothetical protein
MKQNPPSSDAWCSCGCHGALGLGQAAWIFRLSPPFSFSKWYGQLLTGTTPFVDTSVTFALGLSPFLGSWVEAWGRPELEKDLPAANRRLETS